jgi:hypothetical protein
MSEVNNIRFATYSAMNRLGISDMRPYERLEVFGMEYYRDSMKSHGLAPTVKVIYAKMNDLNIIPMPNDYVSYTAIAYRRNGRLFTLGLDNKIPLLTGLSPCSDSFESIVSEQTQGQPNNELGYYLTPHFYNGQYMERAFAQGGGFNEGYYREDRQNRLIQFDTRLPKGEVVIEYVSDGKECSGDTVIGGEFVPCMREHIVLTYQRFNKNLYNGQDISLTMQTLETYEIKARAVNGRTFEEMLDALYRTNGIQY